MTEVKKSRSEIKHEAIVEAAKSAFQEFGVQATSMDRLAEIAGVSKRTVYNHFATKAELVLYLLTDNWETSLLKSAVVYDPDKPLYEQFVNLVEEQVTSMSDEQHIELVRVAIGSFFYEQDTLRKGIDRLISLETAAHRFIKAAVKDNALIIKDVNFAVDQLNDLVKGRCFWPLVFKLQSQLTEDEKRFVIEQSVDIFLDHYSSSRKQAK
ncbi:TetR/AcrR family transcriptional regulator [Aliiglaciecola sp. 3_MG-2023]|uniref:TetR/AcrR family transcriptional regulator n=1 Tax=Aliiglaciecola sp. 3_MG-2023 TaxID=3062644 RepID=UPI0026E2C9EB|nr:TetR/AcrR family transcriptional regulator [Aliiglaciecola sp. 3_MG-2023]MDO6693084.1 TetR/AcrR family transcriptional regulator [Aliiglaciecola sp. 3_MG-2023]